MGRRNALLKEQNELLAEQQATVDEERAKAREALIGSIRDRVAQRDAALFRQYGARGGSAGTGGGGTGGGGPPSIPGLPPVWSFLPARRKK